MSQMIYLFCWCVIMYLVTYAVATLGGIDLPHEFFRPMIMFGIALGSVFDTVKAVTDGFSLLWDTAVIYVQSGM